MTRIYRIRIAHVQAGRTLLAWHYFSAPTRGHAIQQALAAPVPQTTTYPAVGVLSARTDWTLTALMYLNRAARAVRNLGKD